MQTETRTGIRISGLAVGVVIGTAALVVVMHAIAVPRGTGALGADVTLIANSTGEIQVAAPGPFVHGAGLHPGDSVEGTLTLANIAQGRLGVSLQATPSIRDLNEILMIEVSGDGGTVYRGSLGGMVNGSPPFPLAPGGSETLNVRVWLPTAVGDGYQGRIDDVVLAFLTRSAGGP